MFRFYQCFLLLFGLTFSWLIPTAQAEQDAPNTVHYEEDIYFYHTDHLGGTRYITDKNGDVVESILTFPGGEPWVNQTIRRSADDYKTPYTFTGKEQDASGLYYYGARYYDPRAQIWASVDPILNEYLGNDPSKLKGMGGVFNSRNLGMYSYGHNNPINLIDHDGNMTDFIMIHDPVLYYEMRAKDLGYDPYTKEGAYATADVVHNEAVMEIAVGLTFGALGGIAKSFSKSRKVPFKVEKWGIPKGVTDKFPTGWVSKANKKGTGTRWQDPDNTGNGVRIDQGNPNHSLSSQQVDHVVVRRNGKVIGRDEKPIQGSIKENAEQAHIPLSEYQNWNSWDSPL